MKISKLVNNLQQTKVLRCSLSGRSVHCTRSQGEALSTLLCTQVGLPHCAIQTQVGFRASLLCSEIACAGYVGYLRTKLKISVDSYNSFNSAKISINWLENTSLTVHYSNKGNRTHCLSRNT